MRRRADPQLGLLQLFHGTVKIGAQLLIFRWNVVGKPIGEIAVGKRRHSLSDRTRNVGAFLREHGGFRPLAGGFGRGEIGGNREIHIEHRRFHQRAQFGGDLLNRQRLQIEAAPYQALLENLSDERFHHQGVAADIPARCQADRRMDLAHGGGASYIVAVETAAQNRFPMR